MAQITLSFDFEVDWNFDSAYTDESSRVISINGSISLGAIGSSSTSGRGVASSMSVILDNSDNRYSALNSGSALYSVLQDGKAYHAPCRLRITTDGSSPGADDAQFVGVIKLPREDGRTATKPGTITLDCVSREELLMQSMVSTGRSDFAGYYDDGKDEGEIIAAFLGEMGVISDGVDYVSQEYGGTTTIDRGLFTIPWAWLDNESPVEDAWALAAACGGRFYAAAHDGKFYYENATHLLTDTRSASSQETLTEANTLSFGISYDDRDMYNAVVVEYSGREVGPNQVIWQPEEIVIVPADTTLDYDAVLQQPAYSIDQISYTATTAGGIDISSDVSIAQTQKAQRIEMSITNANTTQAAILRSFSIIGQPVMGRPTAEERRNSAVHGNNSAWWTTPDRGDRARTVRGNPYLQTQQQAAMLADFLLNRQEYPALKYRADVLGSSTRRVGDRVTFDFAGAMDSARTAIISTIRFRLNQESYTQTIEAIDTANLYPYIDATYDYFVLSTSGGSTLGTSHADRGRLFF